MSRAKRRAGRGSARGRRTPARPATGRGPRIPWTPVIVVLGVVVAALGGAYLIWQQGGESSSGFEDAAVIEADPAPDLPGEWVNLPEIYGEPYPDTAGHVRRDVDYSDQGLPPAGGPHWGQGECPDDPDDQQPFCGPVRWGIYREPWEAESLVHNMEHGGTILWYNTADQEIIDELEDLIGNRLDGDELLVIAPYLEMEDEYIAITAWARRDMFPVSEYSKDRVEDFLDAFRCRFNPEGVGGRGC